jgi:hypothetical protein
MTDNQLPAYFHAPHPSSGTSLAEMTRMIAATTDMNALASTVADAYRLTVSLERDIIAIKAHYATLQKSNLQFHQEIMAALEGRFAERAAQIAFIREAATQLIAEKQFDIAHSIINQLMQLLQISPVDEAFSKQRR